MMKLFFSLFIALFICIQASQASIIIFGELDKVSDDNKNRIFKKVIVPFPDIKELIQEFADSNLKFEFIPPTAFQILEYAAHGDDQKSLNRYGRIWNSIDGSTIEKHSRVSEESYIYQRPVYQDDFFLLNKKLQQFGQNTEALIAAAESMLPETPILTSNDPESFLTKGLYKRIIGLEREAFETKQTLLWRFTNGLPAFPGWLDSILEMSSPSFIENPIVYQGNENNKGFSYSLRPLDGIYFESQTFSDPFQDYDSITAAACPLAFLKTHLLQLTELDKPVGENNSDTKKRQARLKELEQRALYCLLIPQEELSTLPKYFYDSCHINLPHMGLRTHGEYSHCIIFTKAKDIKNATIHDWSWTPPSSKAGYIETPEDRKKFIESWFRWMAQRLHILYQGNKIVSGTNSQTNELYKDFYSTKIESVLSKIK